MGNTIEMLKISSFIIILFQADIFLNSKVPAFIIHSSFSEIYYTVKTDTPKVVNFALFYKMGLTSSLSEIF